MPRASKQFLENSMWVQIHDTLIEVFAAQNKDELKTFLSDFLTKEEKTMLAKRLTLYIMILSGYADNEIAEILKVSRETIRSAKNALDSKRHKFRDKLTNWVKESEQINPR